MKKNSKIYKISYFIGQLICLVCIVFISICTIFLLYKFIYLVLPSFIKNTLRFYNKLQNTFFDIKWLNENQGLLSLISIVIAVLPFIIQMITLQQLWKWRGEYNEKVEKVSSSIMVAAMSLFRTRIDLKKHISKNEVVVRPKIFMTYPVKYGIENKLEDGNTNYFIIKINLLVILEYLFNKPNQK